LKELGSAGYPFHGVVVNGVTMDAGLAPARHTRARHRHELRTLTYVTVDQANGGIVRDISDEGMGMQVVGAVRPQQQLGVRFELRHPRVRVETLGEVTWATRSGQCGVRFLDLSPQTARHINEWIFGNLLEEASLHTEQDSIFAPDQSMLARSLSVYPERDEGEKAEPDKDDGLMVSATPVKVIELPAILPSLEPVEARADRRESAAVASSEWDWLAQPLSGRGLIWTINTLVVVAALLLFALVFLSITGEPPRWPLAMAGAAAVFVGALYWGFFRMFGGASPGARLARLAGWNFEDDEATNARFR
jgi:PilZ domain